MERRINYHCEIQQDKKDIKRLFQVILETLILLYWYLILQVRFIQNLYNKFRQIII